jgi:hypothetical protein
VCNPEYEATARSHVSRHAIDDATTVGRRSPTRGRPISTANPPIGIILPRPRDGRASTRTRLSTCQCCEAARLRRRRGWGFPTPIPKPPPKTGPRNARKAWSCNRRLSPYLYLVFVE